MLISCSRCSKEGSILITFISITSNKHNACGRRTDDVEMNERLINVEGLKDLLFFLQLHRAQSLFVKFAVVVVVYLMSAL